MITFLNVPFAERQNAICKPNRRNPKGHTRSSVIQGV